MSKIGNQLLNNFENMGRLQKCYQKCKSVAQCSVKEDIIENIVLGYITQALEIRSDTLRFTVVYNVLTEPLQICNVE